MNKTGKAVSSDERLRRAQAEVDRALAMSEPTEARAHGEWIRKRRSCVLHADQELRAARRLGADEVTIAQIDAQVQRVWNETKLRH